MNFCGSLLYAKNIFSYSEIEKVNLDLKLLFYIYALMLYICYDKFIVLTFYFVKWKKK
ncbi:hypothetical protein Lalb_Chr18g0051061 [Lupinus albus]|uniref:Uncharacterized protein n=1 Tax=Lupinus albus TaxID=3870 RepID=A0A6A4P3J5_LUPAL|nr:hypothetical protein Lalb_Chr18g0051061 [Lupinus albus]